MAFPQCPATVLHLCPGRPTSQAERIIPSREPIQSSASWLTLPTEVPINANYNGDFSDMGTYSSKAIKQPSSINDCQSLPIWAKFELVTWRRTALYPTSNSLNHPIPLLLSWSMFLIIVLYLNNECATF